MSTPYRAGMFIEDRCRVCKEVRGHTVIVVDPEGRPLRVICDWCKSQHNYRGGGERRASASSPASGPRSQAPRDAPSLVDASELISSNLDIDLEEVDAMELEMLLRRIIREEAGLTPEAPAERWQGGELVLIPGKAGTKEYRMPLETFFRKIIAVRNRLRVLEQQVNGDTELSDAAKLKLQGYITACYGSLTSFNVLFADEDGKFKGQGG